MTFGATKAKHLDEAATQLSIARQSRLLAARSLRAGHCRVALRWLAVAGEQASTAYAHARAAGERAKVGTRAAAMGERRRVNGLMRAFLEQCLRSNGRAKS